MCPARYCPNERTRRPAIIPNLKGGRAERFGQFIRSIHASSRPTLVDEARAAAARSLGLPAVRASVTARGPGAPARDADGAGLLRRLPDESQRAALPAPARIRGSPARPDDRAAQEPGHVRRHADRRDGRPRLRVEGGRADAPQRQPLERERAGPGSAVREGAGSDARPRERCARPDPRRDSHDRGRPERAARLPRGRPLGVLARGSRAGAR